MFTVPPRWRWGVILISPDPSSLSSSPAPCPSHFLVHLSATQGEALKKFRKTLSRALQYFLSRREKVDKTVSLAFSQSAWTPALDGRSVKTITETFRWGAAIMLQRRRNPCWLQNNIHASYVLIYLSGCNLGHLWKLCILCVCNCFYWTVRNLSVYKWSFSRSKWVQR